MTVQGLRRDNAVKPAEIRKLGVRFDHAEAESAELINDEKPSVAVSVFQRRQQ